MITVNNPYNLSKLLCYILQHTKEEKRAVFVQDLNQNEEMWKDDDKLKDYREEIRSTFLDSIVAAAGEAVGAVADRVISTVSTVAKVLGGAARVVTSVIRGIFSIFG